MKSAGRTHRTRRTRLTGAMFFSLAATSVTALVAGCTAGGGSSNSRPATPASSAVATPDAPAASTSTPGTASSSTPPAAPTPTPTSATATATPSAPAPSASTSVPAGTPACSTSGLQASVGVSEGAAGSLYQVIDFTNISGSPCTLFGYPGVALATGSPVTQVGAAASRSSAAAATLVTLPAGATANALLRITEAVNYPASHCHPVPTTYLQIYPPNQTTPSYLAYKSTGCAVTKVPLLSIGVVRPGTGASR